MKVLKKIEGVILKGEYVLVIVVLLTMCFLAFIQVILRNFFSFSFVWADVIVRMGVLWVAILGASIATSSSSASTSESGHIRIDLFSKILPRPYDEYLNAFLSLFAAAGCFIFLLVSLKFVSVMKGVGNVDHALHAPEWLFTLIFPIGFSVMTFKFLLCFLVDLGDIKRERGKGEE